MKKEKLNLVFCLLLTTSNFLFISYSVLSQNTGIGINITGNPANTKSLLDIDVTGMNPKAGLLLPRMSTQERDAIVTPIPESLLIYNTDNHCFEAYYNGVWVSWACLGGCQIPTQPNAGINNPSQTQIVWNWSGLNNATSYKWATSNTFSSATDNGSSTSFTQTNLTCNNTNILYVWAYNTCGNSTYSTLTQAATGCGCDVSCNGSGTIGSVAGNDTAGYNGDGGQAGCAELKSPYGIVLDAAGNVYIADRGNDVIRKVTLSTGIISTIAGKGSESYSGDGGPATSAEFNWPTGIALDGSGNIYIADHTNNRIRKISSSTGIITTIAGNGTAGFSGDGGPATDAKLYWPFGIALDSSGNIYIADQVNFRIRKLTISTGIISTIAGSGTYGYTGDGGVATSADLKQPTGIALDKFGNVYFAEEDNHVIRKITVSTGIITTIAGNGTSGFTGDGGAATNSLLSSPYGVATDDAGNIYIADAGNAGIRKITISTGIISTISGIGIPSYSGDGGSAVNAGLNSPVGIALDALENIYIGDTSNNLVRKICK